MLEKALGMEQQTEVKDIKRDLKERPNHFTNKGKASYVLAESSTVNSSFSTINKSQSNVQKNEFFEIQSDYLKQLETSYQRL